MNTTFQLLSCRMMRRVDCTVTSYARQPMKRALRRVMRQSALSFVVTVLRYAACHVSGIE